MNYSSLTHRLEELVADSASVVECESVLATLGLSHIGELFESILSDTATVEQIQRESFLHQPGFNRFVLKHDRDLSWRLRLNVWWPQYAARLRQTVNIHNHVWDHTSLIVAGVLENRFYSVIPGDDMLYYESILKGTPDERVELKGRMSVEESEIEICRSGETYHQYHRQFHRIVPQTDFLATLCFQSPPRTDSAYALLRDNDKPVQHKSPQPSVSEVRALFIRAVSQIRNENR